MEAGKPHAARLARAVRLDVLLHVSVPIWSLLLAVLAAAVVAKLRLDVPWYFVMGDPATATGRPFFVGFVSNVGVVMWAATATVFLFRHHLERVTAGASEWSRFLLASGLFTALLGLDDLFLLHDQVLPDYLSISQSLAVAAYGAACFGYLARFARQIARTAYPVFLLALAFLATSVGLDQMQDHWSLYLPASGFLEDAAKLAGIGTWLSYAWHTCTQHPANAPGVAQTKRPAFAGLLDKPFAVTGRAGGPRRPSS